LKKLLFIINPNSGKMRAKSYVLKIIQMFSKKGYVVTVYPTEKSGHGIEIAENYAKDFDLVVCCGGDGTLNEVVQGIMKSGANVPVGYIPAGSTNDLATSIKLPKSIMKAADFAVSNPSRKYDLGLFDDVKYFNYIASFGAFTETSYNTPQSLKNSLGHLAYILEGAKSLGNIYSFDMKIHYDGNVIEDEFIFGAVLNTTSMGGIMRLNNQNINFNDGMFEVLLIRNPDNVADLTTTINCLMSQKFDLDNVLLFPASEVTFECESPLDWSIDGELYKGSKNVNIKVIKDALNLIY